MPAEEKSVIATTTALVVVYALYFVTIARWATSTPAAEIVYQPLMIVTVVLLVALVVIAHLVIAVTNPRTAELTDERDRSISLRGTRVGAYVLATGVFFALCLAMVRADPFYIANTLLLWWVLAEVLSGVFKIALYRRGA